MNTCAVNMETLKHENRVMLLNIIRKAPISRAGLAKCCQMSKSAVSGIVGELLQEGQIREIGISQATRGRKPILLDIVKNYRYVAGVSLHRKRVGVSLLNLKNEIVDTVAAPTGQFPDAEAVLDYIADSLQRLLERHTLTLADVAGMGISCPGPLNYREGIIETPPKLEKLHHFPIVARLQERFSFPVCLENNAVLLGLLEHNKRGEAAAGNTMFVVMHEGIGSSILQEDRLYRGFKGYSGDIGHTSVNVNGKRCPCGNVGCLELYATTEALADTFGFSDYHAIVDKAYVGETRALHILDYRAKHLACAFVNAINLFDLSRIILFDSDSYRPELLLNRIRDYVDKRALARLAHKVDIQSSVLNPHTAEDEASAAMILNHYFREELTDVFRQDNAASCRW